MKKFIFISILVSFLAVCIYLVLPADIDTGSYIDLNRSIGSGREQFRTEYEEMIYSNQNGDENTGDGGSVVPDPTPPNPTPTPQAWLDICDKVHTDWENQIGYYKLGGKFSYDSDGDGKGDIEVRTDCSGYVGYCLYVAGLLNNPQGVTSSSADSVFKKIDTITEVDKSSIQKGDILVYNGHMEIFFEDSVNGSYLVYNWGGSGSAKQHPTVSGKTKAGITSVWRVSSSAPNPAPNPTGKVVFLDAGHGCTQYPSQRNSHPVYGYAEARSSISTTFNGITTVHDEDDWTEQIRPKIKAELESMGVTVRSLSDYTVPENGLNGNGTKKTATRDWIGNSGRRDIGLELSDASIIVQLHSNALGNGEPNSVNGVLVLSNRAGSTGAQKFVSAWDKSLSSIGVNSSGTSVKTSFAFTSKETKPAYIVEVGFHTNPSDTYQMNHNMDNVAKAVAKSIYAMIN